MNWIEYTDTVKAANPMAFAARLEQMAGQGHQIWYVWAAGYQSYKSKCEMIGGALEDDPGLSTSSVLPLAQVSNPWTPYEEMQLLRSVPKGG